MPIGDARLYREALCDIMKYLKEKIAIGIVDAAHYSYGIPVVVIVRTSDTASLILNAHGKVYQEILCPTLAQMFYIYQLIPCISRRGVCPPLPLRYHIQLYPGTRYTGMGQKVIHKKDVPGLEEFMWMRSGVIWTSGWK